MNINKGKEEINRKRREVEGGKINENRGVEV